MEVDLDFENCQTNMFLCKAVFNKSVEMLKLILDKIPFNNDPDVPHSSFYTNPRYWTSVLRLPECDKLLEEAGIPNISTRVYLSPLNTVHLLDPNNFDSALKLKIVRSLLAINYSATDGTFLVKKLTCETPLITAYKHCDIPITRVLLSHGANPEDDKQIRDLGYSPWFLAECLYYNADIFRPGSTVVSSLCQTDMRYRRRYLLVLLLECDCDISRGDLQKVRRIYSTRDENLIKEYFEKPLSLMSLCRKVFRRHCGYLLHEVLEDAVVPRSIRRYLLLEKELETLREGM